MTDCTRTPAPTQATTEQLTRAEEILDQLPPSAGRVLCLVAGYERGARGECRAKVATIAAKLGLGDRQVRRLLAALRDAGLWERVDRRRRWSSRVLTDLGRLCASILYGARIERVDATPPQMSAHMSGHKGEAEHTPEESPRTSAQERPERPGPASAAEYAPPNRGGSLTPITWRQLALWIDADGKPASWARCKIAHRTFARLAMGLGRTREFRRFAMLMGGGKPCSAEYLVARAIQSARRKGADFGSVETALAYTGAIVDRCVREHRWPS